MGGSTKMTNSGGCGGVNALIHHAAVPSLTREEDCCLKAALAMVLVKRRLSAAAVARQATAATSTKASHQQEQAAPAGIGASNRSTTTGPLSLTQRILGVAAANDDEPEDPSTSSLLPTPPSFLLSSPSHPSHIKSMMNVAVAMAQQLQHQQQQPQQQQHHHDTFGALSPVARQQIGGIVCHLAHQLESLLQLQQHRQHQQSKSQSHRIVEDDAGELHDEPTTTERSNVQGWIRETLITAGAIDIPSPVVFALHGNTHQDSASIQPQGQTQGPAVVSRLEAVTTVFRVMLLESSSSSSSSNRSSGGGSYSRGVTTPTATVGTTHTIRNEGSEGHFSSNKKQRRLSPPPRPVFARSPPPTSHFSTKSPSSSSSSSLLDRTILQVVALLLRDLYHGNKVEVVLPTPTPRDTSWMEHCPLNRRRRLRSPTAAANDLAVHCLFLLETTLMRLPNALREVSSLFSPPILDDNHRLGGVAGFGGGGSSDCDGTDPARPMNLLAPIAVCDLANFYHASYHCQVTMTKARMKQKQQQQLQLHRCGHSGILEGENDHTTTTTTATMFLQLDPGAKILLHLGLYRILQKVSMALLD
jgi:hypothetical protein